MNVFWATLNQSHFRSMAEVSFRSSANTRKRASAEKYGKNEWQPSATILVSICCVYILSHSKPECCTGQRSRFLVLTKRSAASGDETGHNWDTSVSWINQNLHTSEVKSCVKSCEPESCRKYLFLARNFASTYLEFLHALTMALQIQKLREKLSSRTFCKPKIAFSLNIFKGAR